MSIDFKRIFELRLEINALLRERPDLQPLQDKIDATLKTAGSQHNRCALVNDMMLESLKRLREELLK